MTTCATRSARGVVVACVLAGPLLAPAADAPPGAKLEPVPMTQVHVRDAFWSPRIETVCTKTLPLCLDWCEKTGRVSNFAKAAGLEKGAFVGKYFNDSDLYKVLEGAAYVLALRPDKDLAARVDRIIDVIAAAQQPDGYLNTYFTLVTPDRKWTDLSVMHELYCAGHLIEAGVAFAEATGKTRLLDVARRMADHIDATFGPEKKFGYSGHPEIELALFRLYRHTGEERYRKLSQWFLDVRGTKPLENQRGDAWAIQAHKPIREQTDIVGHAVRAMYLYSAVADRVYLDGDPGYAKTLETIWESVVNRKMYITGGVGAQREHEAFGADYSLPNDTAYAETCACIALAFWNQRMLMLKGEGRFADVVERALYNGVLSGLALDGERFFYENPLTNDGTHRRQPWYDTACCPSNLVRVIPSIGGYIFARTATDLYVDQYIGSTASLRVGEVDAKVAMETDYPWSGVVKLRLDIPKATMFRVHLRVPEWAGSAEVAVNGEPVHHVVSEKGYAVLPREWRPGDVITLTLPMEPQRVEANPKVAADRGRVALQRGPLLYCLEAADNDGRVFDLALPRDVELKAGPCKDLLGGIVVIQADGVVASQAGWENRLYGPARSPRSARIRAVPYYAWGNRDPGEMTVWIPESVGLTAVR